jgi:hypothetical protein
MWTVWCVGCVGWEPKPEVRESSLDSDIPDLISDIEAFGPIGDLPHVTMHVDPDCGTGVALGDMTGLRRWPYLQNIKQTSAVVAWGLEVGTEEPTLKLYEPKGKSTTVGASVTTLPMIEPMDLAWARLKNLQPDTQYCYTLYSGELEVAGALSFKTAPADEDAAIKFFVLGDFGNSYPAQKDVRAQMEKSAEGIDFWITTGDNAYSSGTYDQFQDHVFGIYPELMVAIPMYPTPGNHDWGMGTLDAYRDNFFLPENSLSADDYEAYYSFDYGPVHFLMLDSERGKTAISDERTDDMRDFAEADLAAAGRPWKIAAFHHPIISGMPGREADILMADNFSPVFEEHGVQLVLAGHNHMYERFVPLKGGKPADDGVTYVTTGGGGASLYSVGTNDYQAVVEPHYHYMIIEADPCELKGRAIDSTGAEIDSFTFTQC